MDIPIDIIVDYPPPSASPAPSESTSCPRKCFKRALSQLTFSLALFSGLSLAMAGLFRERIGNEELDANRVQYKSKKLGLAGLVIVVYAFIGLCLCWSREVYSRYKIFCAINMMLSVGTLAYSVVFGEASGEYQTIDAMNED